MMYQIVDSRGSDYYNDVTLYDTEETAEIALAEALAWVAEQAKYEPTWKNARLRIEEVAA